MAETEDTRNTKTRYSDEELAEFREIIEKKLEKARKKSRTTE